MTTWWKSLQRERFQTGWSRHHWLATWRFSPTGHLVDEEVCQKKVGWTLTISLMYMLDHQVGRSWSAWDCGRLSWQLLFPPPEEKIVKNVTKSSTILVVHMKMRKEKQKTDPGVLGAHNFYWVEGELLIVVHLEISQRSSKHSRNKFNSKKDLRVYLGLLCYLQEAHLRTKNENSKFFGQTFWFRTLTPNPPTFRVGWGLSSILLDCLDRNN